MATPVLPLPAPNWWKKLAIRAFFFGVGAATVCALVIASFLLYEHHEKTKPWTSPLKAMFTGLSTRLGEEALVVEVDYSVENTTERDYRFPHNSTIMMLLPEGYGYKSGKQAHLTWDDSTFIPARQKVNITVTWTFPSGEFTLPSYDGEESWTDRRLAENNGFAIFDETNKYRIDLPNAWKDWPRIKKVLDAKNRKESQPETVNADVRTWSDAEVDGHCSSRHVLPLNFADEPDVKQLVLNCILKNRIGRAVPIPQTGKVESVILLPDGTTVRGGAIYLGSSKKEIPARGELEGAGLFLPNKCDVKQLDYECALKGLMRGKELLLTDTANGIRFHIRID